MFSSGSFEKSSLGPENSSPGRNNIPNRFPVGIPSSDESQQIRIQLAVQKYNNSGTSPLNNGRTLISPVRHSFLKNSLRAKNREGDAETTLKNDKIVNQYEGVGAFPTIHLKKSSVRYRPIRRFNEVKVPYPELPVNRFLSHLPELCPDMKSSTRSVLDVLQDLSGKQIHGKDDDDCNKPRSRGLGGDYYMDPSAAYKPLFVQKPKINSVLTKDNTTQTSLLHNPDTPTSQCNSSVGKNDSLDPRAELRRRLARQNNEIFASLSSSISSSFPVKRKLDKVLPAADDDSTEGSAVKKSKIFENHTNNYEENGVSKLVKNGKTSSNDSVKLSRKIKLTETNSTSPNKDRLTTIFLDLQNTSPKSQVFQSKSPSTELKNPAGDNAPVTTSTGSGILMDKIGSPHINGSLGANNVGNGLEANNSTSSPNFNFIKHTADTEKQDAEPQSNKVMFNFPASNAVSSTTVSNVTQSNSTTFQFGVNTSSSFTFPKTSIGSVPLAGGLLPAATTAESNRTDVNSDKKDDNNKSEVKTFTFGSSNESDLKKPNFSNFKFGTDVNSSSGESVDINKSPAAGSTEADAPAPAPTIVPVTSSTTTPQFSFGTKASDAKTTSQSSLGITFGQPIMSSSQSADATSVKPLLTFGQNSSSPQNTNKSEEKTESSKIGAPTSVASTQSLLGQSVQSSEFFTFGQKPITESAKNEAKPPVTDPNLNTNTSASSNIFSQVSSSNTVTAPSFTTTFSNQTSSFLPTSTAAQGLKTAPNSLFSFGQKPEVSTAPSTVTSSEGQKSQSTFSFTFGQKTDSTQSKPAESVFGQKGPANLFSFGAKPSESTPTTAVSGPAQVDTAQANPQNLLKQQPASNPSLAFGQNVTPASTASQMPAFGQTPASGTNNAFGAKSESVSFGQMSTPAFGQNNSVFSNKTPSFGSSTASQPVNAFGTSATTQPTTGFGTSTTSIGFGVSTAQSNPAFGAPVSTQSVMGFGNSASTQPSTGFGAPSSTQSTIAFGGGTNQATAGFGTSAFGNAPSTQPNHGFGASATPQSTTGFGLSASSQSFAQPFNNKPTTSLGQTSIFGSTTINQNPVSNTGFGSSLKTGQNNVFGQKTNSESSIFGQANKSQTPAFGENTTSQSFGTPNKFLFGMSTSNSTGFTTSAPNTTAAPVFNFGGGSAGQGSTFSFGGNNSSTPSNTQSPFAFKGATNDAFKFGASAAKEGPGFGGGNARTFNFGGQMNTTMNSSMNNAMGETKPSGGVFNFGNPQVSSSAPGFNFGTTPSPSVFSFGGSGSSASSGSSFNFGTPQPGGPFGQSTPSPATNFPVPGTFSIGSGSSQSRPRASCRLRRRQ